MQNQQKILQIIKNPYQLNEKTLVLLSNLTANYPFCQSLQILLAKNQQTHDKLAFEEQVNRASAYAVDRHKFQRYISDRDKPVGLNETQYNAQQAIELPLEDQPLENPETALDTESEEIAVKQANSMISPLIQTRLGIEEEKPSVSIFQKLKNWLGIGPKQPTIQTTESITQKEKIADSDGILPDQETQTDEKEVIHEKSVTTDESEPTEQDLSNEETKLHNTFSDLETTHFPEESSIEINNTSTIDIRAGKESENIPKPDFTEHEKQAQKPDINFLIEKFLKEKPRIKVSKDLPESQEDLSETSTKDNSEIVTETLAGIYMKQGKKDKALGIYEKLCLKYPEKSSYFAKKIIAIKNEINI